jgi:hypothetical protein
MSDVICTNPQFQSPLNRASKDKFYMVLNLPYILRERSKEDPMLNIESLQISVYGTIVPNVSVPPVELRYFGQSVNVSSHSRPNYPPLNVSFVVDNLYQNYYVLWKWLDLLNDPTKSVYNGTPQEQLTNRENLNSGNESEYQTTISVFALDEYNSPSIEFVYSHCFITSLGGLNYSYRENEFIETTAEFQFNQLNIKNPKK